MSNNLCYYGCGNEAKYYFKNGKNCCSKSFKQCETHRNKTKQQAERDWSDPERAVRGSVGIATYYESRTEEARIQKSEKCRQSAQRQWDGMSEEDRIAFANMRSEIQKEVAKQFSDDDLESMAIKKKETWAAKTKDEISKITEKKSETSRERYGVDWVSQDPDISERQQNKFNHKEFQFPSGRIDRVQGYEPDMLKILLTEGVEEDDIVTSRKYVPEIWYEFEGKKHRYYPDIYIKSQNKIIEVKSTRTWTIDTEKTLAKIQQCKNLGYDAEICIIDKGQIYKAL